MSKYTSLLRYICEAESGFTADELEEKTIDEIIDAARTKIFNFAFPVYDEAFRPTLENEILFHFYMREIGAETYGLWKYYLAKTLREIMPYYNQLYRSATLEFNPFYDVDYSKDHSGNETGAKHNTGNVTGHNVKTGQTTDDATTNTTESTNADHTHTTAANGTLNKNEHTVTDTTSTETLNKNTTGTSSGTSDKTTAGSKTVSNQFSESGVERNAYSDTPQTSVLGVEGDGSGDPTNNVSDNYYLTNYRKITNSKSGSGSGTENTSGTENAETSGTTAGTETATTNGTTHGVGDTTTTQTTSDTENNVANDTSETTGSNVHTATGTSRDELNAVTDTTGNETYTNTDDYTDHVFGKMGTQSYSSLLAEYRETFLNINKMVFDELETCFMQIY